MVSAGNACASVLHEASSCSRAISTVRRRDKTSQGDEKRTANDEFRARAQSTDTGIASGVTLEPLLDALCIGDPGVFAPRIEQHDDDVARANLGLHHKTASGFTD